MENYDNETHKAAKTAIFRERTIQRYQPVTAVDSPKEALIVTLNEKGKVDLVHMAKLLSRPAEDFLPELKGAVFLNPESKEWETEDMYLSGDVRDKLKIAQTAVQAEARFNENVTALKAVQPEDLTATQIDARLGACWIPPKDIEKFCQELLCAEEIKVQFVVQVGTWMVSGDHVETQKKSKELEAKIGEVFEHEEKLESLVKREKDLADALDIAKNQAAASLAAEETEVQTEQESESPAIQNQVKQSPNPSKKAKEAPKVRLTMAA